MAEYTQDVDTDAYDDFEDVLSKADSTIPVMEGKALGERINGRL